ncbi:MAG: hypothetical protein ACI89J_004039, partial [Hyphomicrobiaceae bacterium]
MPHFFGAQLLDCIIFCITHSRNQQQTAMCIARI